MQLFRNWIAIIVKCALNHLCLDCNQKRGHVILYKRQSILVMWDPALIKNLKFFAGVCYFQYFFRRLIFFCQINSAGSWLVREQGGIKYSFSILFRRSEIKISIDVSFVDFCFYIYIMEGSELCIWICHKLLTFRKESWLKKDAVFLDLHGTCYNDFCFW